MASILRSDLLNTLSDSALETAISTVLSSFRSQWPQSTNASDTQTNLQLRKEVIGFLSKRLAGKSKRKEYGYV